MKENKFLDFFNRHKVSSIIISIISAGIVFFAIYFNEWTAIFNYIEPYLDVFYALAIIFPVLILILIIVYYFRRYQEVKKYHKGLKDFATNIKDKDSVQLFTELIPEEKTYINSYVLHIWDFFLFMLLLFPMLLSLGYLLVESVDYLPKSFYESARNQEIIKELSKKRIIEYSLEHQKLSKAKNLISECVDLEKLSSTLNIIPECRVLMLIMDRIINIDLEYIAKVNGKAIDSNDQNGRICLKEKNDNFFYSNQLFLICWLLCFELIIFLVRGIISGILNRNLIIKISSKILFAIIVGVVLGLLEKNKVISGLNNSTLFMLFFYFLYGIFFTIPDPFSSKYISDFLTKKVPKISDKNFWLIMNSLRENETYHKIFERLRMIGINSVHDFSTRNIDEFILYFEKSQRALAIYLYNYSILSSSQIVSPFVYLELARKDIHGIKELFERNIELDNLVDIDPYIKVELRKLIGIVSPPDQAPNSFTYIDKINRIKLHLNYCLFK